MAVLRSWGPHSRNTRLHNSDLPLLYMISSLKIAYSSYMYVIIILFIHSERCPCQWLNHRALNQGCNVILIYTILTWKFILISSFFSQTIQNRHCTLEYLRSYFWFALSPNPRDSLGTASNNSPSSRLKGWTCPWGCLARGDSNRSNWTMGRFAFNNIPVWIFGNSTHSECLTQGNLPVA